MSKLLRRAAAAIALTATLGALAGMPSADAAISTQAWCANVQSGRSGFTDIGAVAPAQRQDIECLQASGITSGTTPTTYAPTAAVTRAAMATFVAKLVDLANQLETSTIAALPANPSDEFTDDEGNVHEDNINRLAAANIVRGTSATTYSPAASVRREQMASFLVQAVEYMLNSPLPAGSDAFTDDETSVHEANINKLANIDVVDGVGGSAYSPGTVVSRAQMASFLIRTLAYLHSQGRIAVLTPTTQTITMTPAGPVTNETDSAAGGEVSFTASNIAVTDVDIRLFPCESITGQNPLRFGDTNPNDNAADPRDDLVEADILTVNGSAQAANTEFVGGVAATNGSITFTVDSSVVDCVVATVWDDADDDDRLDLDANDRPTERFGAATVQFVPPPAATGAMDEQVMSTDKGANSFVGCELNEALPGAGSQPEQVSATDCFRFTYDSNDTFTIGGTAASLAEFEQALSTGDDVSGNYRAATGEPSQFALTDESPAAPGSVTAQAVDGDSVIVTFNEVAGADSYRVYFRADPGPVNCPAFATSGAGAYTAGPTRDGGAADLDADTTNAVAVDGLSPGTRYCFVVTALDEGDESPPSTAANATTTSTVDNTGPLAVDTRHKVNAPTAETFDNSDQLQVCFNEDIEDFSDGNVLAPQAESITLRDGDGTTVTLTNGGSSPNATFTRGAGGGIVVESSSGVACAPNRTMTVEVTAALGGQLSTTGLIVDLASEVEDLAQQAWNPDAAGNTDVSVDELA